MTISEAARCIGHKSRSQLNRLLKDVYLHEHVLVQQRSGQLLMTYEACKTSCSASSRDILTACS